VSRDTPVRRHAPEDGHHGSPDEDRRSAGRSSSRKGSGRWVPLEKIGESRVTNNLPFSAFRGLRFLESSSLSTGCCQRTLGMEIAIYFTRGNCSSPGTKNLSRKPMEKNLLFETDQDRDSFISHLKKGDTKTSEPKEVPPVDGQNQPSWFVLLVTSRTASGSLSTQSKP